MNTRDCNACGVVGLTRRGKFLVAFMIATAVLSITLAFLAVSQISIIDAISCLFASALIMIVGVVILLWQGSKRFKQSRYHK